MTADQAYATAMECAGVPMPSLCRCGHALESHGILQHEGGREGCRVCLCRGWNPEPTPTLEAKP
jgi:hypothetical protein